MRIVGPPDQLATFIRALNDEPVYIVEERPREVPLPPVRRTPTPPENLATAWLIFAIFGAFALAMITAYT